MSEQNKTGLRRVPGYMCLELRCHFESRLTWMLRSQEFFLLTPFLPELLMVLQHLRFDLVQKIERAVPSEMELVSTSLAG